MADGASTFSYSVTVKDSNGNPVPGATITPAADKMAVTTLVNGTTNAEGVAIVTLQSSTTAVSNITVSASTGNGAVVQADKSVSFIADTLSATVSNVVLEGSEVTKIADGINSFTYKVIVRDVNGNLVPGVTVTAKADKPGVSTEVSGVTDQSGETRVRLNSTTSAVAEIMLSAQVESSAAINADKRVSFIAELASAAVSSVTLNGQETSKVADGVNSFIYTAVVKDRHGNPVQGVSVTPAVDKSAVTVEVSAVTNAEGETLITLTSSTTAVLDIMVNARIGTTDAVEADHRVSITGNIASAVVSQLILEGDVITKSADGRNNFTYTATVLDTNQNPVPGATITAAATSSNVTIAVNGVTNRDGQTTVTLTSTITAALDIMLVAQTGSSASKNANKTVSFTGDSASVLVSSVILQGSEVVKAANGQNSFTYIVTVKDSTGNRVPGVSLQASADKPGVNASVQGITNRDGEVSVTLTSTTTAALDVMVSAHTDNTTPVDANQRVSFTGDVTSAKVSLVTLNGAEVSKVANGNSAFTYTVSVIDAHGNAVPGVSLIATADTNDVTTAVSGTTDYLGQSTITLTSTTRAALDIMVNAQVVGGTPVNANKTVNFTGNVASGSVSRVELNGNSVSKAADGVSTFTYTAIVRDGNGNLVPDAVVIATADKSGVTTRVEGVTDREGQVVITLTSTTTAALNVLVSAKLSNTSSVDADKKVSFTGDLASATVSTVELNGTEISKPADGQSQFTYTVTVKDRHGNRVPGALFTASADKSGVTALVSGVTNDAGQAVITLQSSTVAALDIMVSAQAATGNAVDANKSVSFTGNLASAAVSSVVLEGSETSKIANGVNTFTYIVTVKDQNGNRVPGATVTSVADKSGVSVAVSSITDRNGQSTVTLTSSTIAALDIMVSAVTANTTAVNADKKVSFIAELASAAVSNVVLNGTQTSKIADGINNFTYTVTVKDRHGNLVPGATVIAGVNKTGVGTAVMGLTNNYGQVTVTLTSTTEAVADIIVHAGVGSTATVNAQTAVSFVADQASAAVKSVILVGTETERVANGTSSFSYSVTVKDNNGNPVPGVTPVVIADKSGVSTSVSTPTDAHGVTVIRLTSTTTAVANIMVTAQVGNSAAANADKRVSFIAELASATVSSVVLNGSETRKVADGVNSFTYTVTVKDRNGNLVPGAAVTVSASKSGVTASVSGVTRTNGTAILTLTSSKKAVEAVRARARVGTSTQVEADREVSFIADAATATVTSVVLNGSETSKVADGVNRFTYTVTVKDSNGNLLPGATIVAAADKSAVSVSVSGVTNSEGVATITLISTTTAVAQITVSAQTGSSAAVSASPAVNFIADRVSATVTSVVLNGSETCLIANGLNSFTYTVTVKDSNGNRVPGVGIVAVADKAHVTTGVSGITDTQGVTTVTLTSTTTAVSGITVSAGVNSQSYISANQQVSFIADLATAAVSEVSLNGSETRKVADGVNSFTYAVTVKDSNGNRVPGAAITVAADKAGVSTSVSGVTDAQGVTTITLTSSSTAVADILVSARVSGTTAADADMRVSFIADLSSAKVSSVVLDGTVTSKVANGSSSFTYTVTVKDRNGNLVPGAEITTAADKAAVSTAVSGITDAQGVTRITLTSTVTAVADILVNARVSGTEAADANLRVSFTADLASAVVSSVVLDGSITSKVADGVNTFTYSVIVKDSNGNRVPGAQITAAADKAGVSTLVSGLTNAEGVATVTLTSSTVAVADISVSARVANTVASVAADKVSFIADRASATVSQVLLNGTETSKVANGSNNFTYTVRVTDRYGNAVPEMSVAAAADKSYVSTGVSGVTNAQGETTVTLTSSTTAVRGITVSASVDNQPSVNANKQVSFIGDLATAMVSAVVLNGSETSKVADGVNNFTYSVTVKDSFGNRVSGAQVVVTADRGDVITSVNGVTDEQGEITATLTSTTTAVYNVTLRAQVGSGTTVNADKTVNFIFDESSARVSVVLLEGDVVSKVANGSNSFTFIAQLVDSHGNAVRKAGLPVSWSQNKGQLVTLPGSSMTDANGRASIILTSTTTAVSKITVTGQYQATTAVNASKNVSFIYDVATAKVSSVVLNDATVLKVANGSDSFTYTARLSDSNGNAIAEAGLTVSWAQDKGTLVTLPATSQTNEHGEATIVLTSTMNGVNDVHVSGRYGTTVAVNADKTVSFAAVQYATTGLVTNAKTGSGLSGAKIELYQNDQLLNTYTSGSDGKFTTQLIAGIYQVKISLSGFITLERTIEIKANGDTSFSFPLSPMLDGNYARIMLSWSEPNPKDLDSHLYVPNTNPAGSRIPINYMSREPSGANANLDLDRQASPGAETITIVKDNVGKYLYFVHAYSTGGSQGAIFKADVTINLSNGQTRSFTPPAQPIEGRITPGSYWLVFELDTTSGEPVITEINTIGNKPAL
ncbi:MAG: hypothetical protein XXXJIFNMEKO3_02220 [Candidatus Erwinia impunctatus]